MTDQEAANSTTARRLKLTALAAAATTGLLLTAAACVVVELPGAVGCARTRDDVALVPIRVRTVKFEVTGDTLALTLAIGNIGNVDVWVSDEYRYDCSSSAPARNPGAVCHGSSRSAVSLGQEAARLGPGEHLEKQITIKLPAFWNDVRTYVKYGLSSDSEGTWADPVVVTRELGRDQSAYDPGFRVKASHAGYNMLDRSWTLSIDGKGIGLLEVWNRIAEGPRRFSIPADQLDHVRKVIEEERFFELKYWYGGLAVDGPERRMTVRLGGREGTVSIYTLGEPDVPEDLKRALRVWDAIRGLFEDTDAADSRIDDTPLLAR